MTEETRDWRALLVKYVAHVMDEEGIAYITDGLLRSPFTAEEQAALEEIEREAHEVNQ